MIANEAQIWSAMQMALNVTEADRAIVSQIHKYAESKIKQTLGYDPEQQAHTEFYPQRGVVSGTPFASVWDVNRAHTHARLERVAVGRETLQLAHIPLRTISALNVDENGRFGIVSGSFGSGTAWTEGDDFWAEYNEAAFCKSGLLHAAGSWPFEPGSVKITYTAGYNRDELEGNYSAAEYREDASAILGGVVKTVMVGYNKWQAWKKPADGLVGTGGPLTSERAQDYQYTRSTELLQALLMNVSVPAEVEDDLEPFRHYGILRT